MSQNREFATKLVDLFISNVLESGNGTTLDDAWDYWEEEWQEELRDELIEDVLVVVEEEE